MRRTTRKSPNRALRSRLMVLDSSTVKGIDGLRERLIEASAEGSPCLLKIEESEIEPLKGHLQHNPLVDFVVKPVSAQVLAARLDKLADTSRALEENVHEIQEAREELDRLTYYDRMTDLPNYEFFRRHLTFQIRHAERYSRQLAVLAVDLQSLGRMQGMLDQTSLKTVLTESSRRIVEQLRGHDVVGQAPNLVPLPDKRMVTRLEGDRFLILLSEFRHVEDISGIVERLLEAISKPIAIAGTTINPSPKVGISLYPDDGSAEDTLIKNAHSALEFSADHRLGQLGFFAESMNHRIADRFSLEAHLRSAVERGEFQVHYQPKVSLASGTTTGLEALLRWEDEKLGVVSPEKFIPLAEELGIINDITRWVVQQVCRQCQSWQRAGTSAPPVAINLSGQDFMHPDFSNFVTEQLLEYEVPPRNLEFEITESSVIENFTVSTKILEDLRYIGVKVSLDDFGTGYSSLGYLQKMPIDTLKIDRSFIRNITSDWNSAAITSGIITLSHILSLNVVAEGVETDEQIQLLKDQNCNEVQGAFYSMPMTAEDTLTWMQTSSVG